MVKTRGIKSSVLLIMHFHLYTVFIYVRSTVHTLWCYVYEKYSTVFGFDPPMQNSLLIGASLSKPHSNMENGTVVHA